MRRLTGFVFDAYDDVAGQVLRTTIDSPTDLPPFVKTATRLTGDQIDHLSDDNFALVMFDEGRKLKKYATVDAGNTVLSVLYLLKQAHLLPKDAVKIAASNLVAACIQHGLDVPGELKTAAKTGTSTSGATFGRHDAANADVVERTNMSGTPGTNDLTGSVFSSKEREIEKTAAPAGATVVDKQKSWRQVPYVDISSWDPAAQQAYESKPAELTLLEGNYAVDGYDQVKTASVYFGENWKQFAPRKRHEYCIKLAHRMGQMGMEVPEEVARYGSETYAADVDSYVEARRSYVHDEYRPALDTLLEKRAQVSPGTFAEALCEFDDISGLRWHWDSKVADPWYSTFGPSLEKLAEAEWSFDENGARCDFDQLKELALNGQSELTKQFGAQFAHEFSKKPKEVFNSMPMPNKIVLARMASGVGDGLG